MKGERVLNYELNFWLKFCMVSLRATAASPRVTATARRHATPARPQVVASGPWDVKPEIQELEENTAQKRRAQKSNESSKTGTGWEAEEPRRTD